STRVAAAATALQALTRRMATGSGLRGAQPGRFARSCVSTTRSGDRLWSLDTGGSERAILRRFPFDQYAFRLLTVEHNRGPLQEEIRRFLESRGYSRFRTLDIRIARKQPRSESPWLDCILTEPAPECGFTDVRHNALFNDLAADFRIRKPRQREVPLT